MLFSLQVKFNYHSMYSQALNYSMHHQNKTQIAYIQARLSNTCAIKYLG